MKIAKFSIAMAAVACMAIGFACVLLSAIAIGVEASTAPDLAEAQRVYQIAVDDANKDYEDNLATWDETHPTPADGVREAYIETIDEIRDGLILDAERDLEEAKVTAKGDGFDRLVGAFTKQEGVVVTNSTGSITHFYSSLSPMGVMMISGMSLLLVGGGLLTAIAVLKKCEKKGAAK